MQAKVAESEVIWYEIATAGHCGLHAVTGLFPRRDGPQGAMKRA